MIVKIQDKQAVITVEPTADGKHRVVVCPIAAGCAICRGEILTDYPPDTIGMIHQYSGSGGLCDAIGRYENPNYVRLSLKYDLLGYVPPERLAGKRLLDFGCGGGASTIILGQQFAQTEIVGIDLNARLLELGGKMAAYYRLGNVRFMASPSPDSLPDNLGKFDFVVLSAVFEHLLPDERRTLMAKLWRLLAPGGVMFINQTPYRYFPVETHTAGLPLINYLPDRLACWYAQRCSRRGLKTDSWQTLLRKGIRGGTATEIMQRLRDAGDGTPMLLELCCLGLRNRIDLWYVKIDRSHCPRLKELYARFVRGLYRLCGVMLLPHLSVAIQKQP